MVLITWEIPRVLGTMSWKPGMKTVYFCYYKSQYHYQPIPSILSSKHTKILPWLTPSIILIQIPVNTCLIYCNIPHWPP